jgi:SAM-dependent methyltransferase
MTPGFDRAMEVAAEHLELTSDAAVLDVPFGKGEALLRTSVTFGCRTVGVDRSPVLVRDAIERIAHSEVRDLVSVVFADGGVLPFADGTFDACLSIGGPSCIGGHDIPSALAEQIRVLQRGGWLVVCDAFRNHTDPNPWLHPDHPDEPGWRTLLEQGGLDVVYTEHFDISAWDEYHAPMRELVAEARRDRSGDRDAMAWADEVEREIEMDLPKGDRADYGAFVARKP